MDVSDNSFYSSEAQKGSLGGPDEITSTIVNEGIHVEMDDESLTSLMNLLSQAPSIEEKIDLCLQQMEISLRGEQGAQLKLFWGIRKHCLSLFQQMENMSKRTDFWRRYTDLTQESRHIKSLKDEEGSFVVGQIELAISCLEKDIANFLSGDGSFVQEEHAPCLEAQVLEEKREVYQGLHNSLVWLGSFASKIIDLRKELIDVGMRMRLKSKFFQRLSTLGNQVFPRRKELVEEVSAMFSQDVASFVRIHFSKGDKDVLKRSVFFLRKEIKSLQQAAKYLLVSSQAFSDTRLQLSQCWDQLRGLEKEIRQEQSRQKAASLENAQGVRERLESIAQLLEQGDDLHSVRRELENVSKYMRSLDLVHDDVTALKLEIQSLLGQIKERQEIEDQNHQEQIARNRQNRQKSMQELVDRITLFSDRCSSGDIDQDSRSEWQVLKDCLTRAAFLSSSERIALDNRLNVTLQHIASFFEEKLLSTPDSREKLANMRQVLAQRQERRKELKDKLEKDKKLLGSSGLDFDQAMQYSALVEEDKQALEELDLSILELKKQIQQLV